MPATIASPVVIVCQAAWQRTMPTVLVEPDLAAIGEFQENRHALAQELIVRRLAIVRTLNLVERVRAMPRGVIISAPRSTDDVDPCVWLNRLQLTPHQQLAIVLVGLGDSRSEWRAAYWLNGKVLPLAALKIIGGEMLQVGETTRVPAESPSPEVLQRWSRTRGALGIAWERVRQSRIAILGVGRNGSVLACQMARLGVRSLTLVDPDRIKLENLDAMHGVTEQDLGMHKAAALSYRLRRQRSDLVMSYLARNANDATVAEALRGVDLIATCADNDTPRLVGAILANRYAKPHLDVATGITGSGPSRMLAGDARLLLPGEGCVACVGGLPQRAEAELELLCPPRALRRGKPLPWQAQRAGSLDTLNTMTVATAVQLWLDLLSGKLSGSRWHRLRWVEGEGIQSDHASVGAASRCEICAVR